MTRAETNPPPVRIAFDNGSPVVDADAIAPLLGIEVDELRRGLQQGQITTGVERGEAEDEGRFRLTFVSAQWRLRLTCDADGNVLSVSRVQRGAPTRLTPHD
ncbi:DUF6522 family protein [Paracoccus stylophorae]|uniref:DUF6522 family protein n=1 Tax=Paracoccus stylophorae TaxID=659350 RepID=UPI00234FC8B5|nr:DUF6522 family protein [Paracoccus stylophorae]